MKILRSETKMAFSANYARAMVRQSVKKYRILRPNLKGPKKQLRSWPDEYLWTVEPF